MHEGGPATSACSEAGVNIVSTQDLVPDEELPNIGDAALGLVTSGIYSAAADRPANKAFLAAWNKEYAGKATPDFLSADGWDGMAAIFDLIKQTKGKFTGDEAMKFLSNWKTRRQPARPDLDRSRHARHRAERLYAQGRDEGRQARQCRVRHHPRTSRTRGRSEPPK